MRAEEYISKNEILDHIKDVYEQAFISLAAKQMVSAFKTYISNLPAADVQEVRHGEWIGDMGNLEYDDYCCRCCGRYTETRNKTRLSVYCGFCGAKMNGRSDT